MNAETLGAPSVEPRRGRFSSAWRIAWPWLFWALWGAWLAASDLRNDEVQPAVIRLLAGAFILGFARPGRWWPWGLALGAWVPAEPIVSSLAGIPPLSPFNAGAALAFIPALLGAGAGAIAASVRRGLFPAR